MEKKTKTSMVQELLEKNPSLKPVDISKILLEKGVDLKNSAVSVIKNRLKKKIKPVAKKRSIDAVKSASNKKSEAEVDFSDLIAIKQLYKSMGSEKIIAAVKALDKINS